MTIAVIFPGQGAQSVGMMQELSASYPIVKEYFAKASDIVGRDLWDIAQNNPDNLLNTTEYTQPIILTASYVAYQILQQALPFTPAMMAGHSLGEYTALCVSGAMSFEEAVRVVNVRGQLMQEAVGLGEGAMAAILGLSNQEIAQACADADGEVYPANYNAPGQVVIGGKTEAVNKAIEAAKALGAKRAVLLPVSVPSHTPLMRVATANLGVHLEKIHWQSPKIKVLFNVDAQARTERYGIESALGAQLYQPVQWVRTVENFAKEGVRACIEVGPGKVLSGLVKRIEKDLHTASFERPEDLEKVKAMMEEV